MLQTDNAASASGSRDLASHCRTRMYGVHTAARRTDEIQGTGRTSVRLSICCIVFLGQNNALNPMVRGHRGHRGFQLVEFSLFDLGLADLGIFYILKIIFYFFIFFFGFYSFLFAVLITLRAKLSGAVYCYRSCL